jgi:hypothetical protein
MASTHKRWAVGVAIIVCLTLTGCTSFLAESRVHALQCFGVQLPPIEKAMGQVVSTTTSPQEAAAKIAAGDMNIGYMFPTPLPADSTLPGSFFIIPRDIRALSSSVVMDVAVGCMGSSGGGDFGARTNLYTCLRYSAEVPATGKISISDAPCPPDIQPLIDANPEYEKVTAKDIPYLANRAQAGSRFQNPTRSESL